MAKPDNTLKRKMREEKENAEDGLKFVIDGAKIRCDLCTVPDGDLKANFDTPSIQDKRVVTVVEKDMTSLIFKGNCKKSPYSSSPCASVMKLTDWKDPGTVYFQYELPVLLRSTIKCDYGGVDIKITDCGQRNLITHIDTIGAPVIPMTRLPQEKIPEYVVLFKRLPSYKGEFGWDHMRDDYLTGTCIEGLEELKKVYKPFEIQTKNITTSVSYGTYYTPWLSMFVNHNTVIGKDVELMIDAPVDFISDNVDFSTEEMTFVPNNSNLRIVPNKMSITDAINGGRIKIFCDAILDADTTIDIKSSKGDIVGKVNVLKNKDVEKLTINIYVIKAFLIDDPAFDKSIIDTKISNLGGLQVIEDYLNKESLNQALIQVKLIYDTKYDWENKKSTLINANEGKDTQTGLLSDSFTQYKGMISNTISMLMDHGKYMDYINDKFNLKFNNLATKRGMFLYLTPFNSPSAGGASYTYPLKSKRIIMFNTNLNIPQSYAHEIGHTLGLEHVFLDKDSFCNRISLNSEKNKINQETNDYKRKVEEAKRKIEADWIKYKQENNTYFTRYPDKITEYKKSYDDNKTAWDKSYNDYEKEQNDRLSIINKNNIRFKRATTENIMDYSREEDCTIPIPNILYKNTNELISFYKNQWKIIQDEAKAYYH